MDSFLTERLGLGKVKKLSGRSGGGCINQVEALQVWKLTNFSWDFRATDFQQKKGEISLWRRILKERVQQKCLKENSSVFRYVLPLKRRNNLIICIADTTSHRRYSCSYACQGFEEVLIDNGKLLENTIASTTTFIDDLLEEIGWMGLI